MECASQLRAGIATAMTAVLITAGPVPVAAPAPIPAWSGEIRLTATVPPGGLLTSFVRNQGIYCSIICPLLAQTGVTALTTAVQSPGTFLAALPRDGLLKAIGIAAASVTGPTDAAMERAIAADAAIPAQRALNAFEVGVVGLLDIVAAFGGGPSAVLSAIARARQQTFDALNAPVVANPTPTVAPHGVIQVAVVQAINVVGAVIFPAFNDVLAGAFQVPDAMAQRLAATGDPVAALSAGIATAVGVVKAAVTVIGDAVVTAVRAIRAAAAAPAAVTAVPSAVTATVHHDSAARSAASAAVVPPVGRRSRAVATTDGVGSRTSLSHTSAPDKTGHAQSVRRKPAAAAGTSHRPSTHRAVHDAPPARSARHAGH